MSADEKPELPRPFWAVENDNGTIYLHAFKCMKSRRLWLMETWGLSARTPGGRSYTSEVSPDPFESNGNKPIFWHD